MGVSTKHIEHNFGNRTLLEGARRLGYTGTEVPQNTGNSAHHCGYCTTGCMSSVKQGPANSFLPDAARAGARFVEGFMTDKVLFEDQAGKRVAVGVKGLWKSRDGHLGKEGAEKYTREVTIKAKKVIVSCGTLNSPLLLLRSGLKNPQIGQNFHLHPATHVGAIFEEDVKPWEGAILTSVVHDFENLDGQGHGVKIEVQSAVPSMILPLIPWKSALDWKVQAARFAKTVLLVIVGRDRDTGRIYPDPVDGRIRAAYTPSAFDKNSLLEGIIGAAKILYAAGAKEVFTTHGHLPRFVRAAVDPDQPEDGINDPAFQTWLEEIRRGMYGRSDGPTIATAHQMGTCRMGSDAKTSVVDPSGKVWGTEGLYVADASVFPSASGVNPMVTNMAISDWTSRNLAKELDREAGKGLARL